MGLPHLIAWVESRNRQRPRLSAGCSGGKELDDPMFASPRL
jgi:hypothetical protein